MKPILEKTMDGLAPINISTWRYERLFVGNESRVKGENSFAVGDMTLPIGKEWVLIDAQYILSKPLVIKVTYILPVKDCSDEKRFVTVTVTYSRKEGSKAAREYSSYTTAVKVFYTTPSNPMFDYDEELEMIDDDLKKEAYPLSGKIAERIGYRFGKASSILAYFTRLSDEDILRDYEAYLIGSFTKYVEML